MSSYVVVDEEVRERIVTSATKKNQKKIHIAGSRATGRISTVAYVVMRLGAASVWILAHYKHNAVILLNVRHAECYIII